MDLLKTQKNYQFDISTIDINNLDIYRNILEDVGLLVITNAVTETSLEVAKQNILTELENIINIKPKYKQF